MVYKLAPLPPPPLPPSSSSQTAFTGLATPKADPFSTTSSPASSRNSTFGRSSARTTLSNSTAPTSLSSSPVKTASSQPRSDPEEEMRDRFPTARIGTDRISDVMAARLAICLLGHVLYLKSQIPFPIGQLLKMSYSRGDGSNTSKKHDALLSSFDILASHLVSTFTALSTSLALSRNWQRRLPDSDIKASNEIENHIPYQKTGDENLAPEKKVHLAFIVGPTITSASAARARIILEICGLEVRVWGERTGNALPRVPRSSFGERSVLEGVSLEAANDGDSTDEEEGEEEEGEDVCSEEGSDCDDESVPDSESDFSNASEEEEGVDIEELLRNAERLLSRTLAIANSDPNLGMAADMRLSQTHILLRAPRRFKHPSWIPRQALSKDMDQFLLKSELTARSSEPRKMSTNVKVKTECVRVTCEDIESEFEETGKNVGEDEEGQMIWWSWDGKMEGFSDF